MLNGVYSLGMRSMSIVLWLLQIYAYVFIIDAVLSWFLKPNNKIRSFLIFLTEPLVSLFRPLEQKIMRNSMFPISLAHLFAYLFLQILQQVLYRIVYFVL